MTCDCVPAQTSEEFIAENEAEGICQACAAKLLREHSTTLAEFFAEFPGQAGLEKLSPESLCAFLGY